MDYGLLFHCSLHYFTLSLQDSCCSSHESISSKRPDRPLPFSLPVVPAADLSFPTSMSAWSDMFTSFLAQVSVDSGRILQKYQNSSEPDLLSNATSFIFIGYGDKTAKINVHMLKIAVRYIHAVQVYLHGSFQYRVLWEYSLSDDNNSIIMSCSMLSLVWQHRNVSKILWCGDSNLPSNQ